MDTDEISLEFLFSCLMTNVHVRNFIYNHKIKRSFVKKINFSATLHLKKKKENVISIVGRLPASGIFGDFSNCPTGTSTIIYSILL